MLAASRNELLKQTISKRCPKHFGFCISREHCLIGILPDFRCALSRRQLVNRSCLISLHGSKFIAGSKCSSRRQLKVVCLMDFVDFRRRKGPRQPDAFAASRSSNAESTQHRRRRLEHQAGCTMPHHLNSPSAAFDRGQPEMALRGYCCGRPRKGEHRPCFQIHASDGAFQTLHR